MEIRSVGVLDKNGMMRIRIYECNNGKMQVYTLIVKSAIFL